MLNPKHAPIPLGPALAGTLLVANADEIISAYAEGLGLLVVSDQSISDTQAAAWNKPTLAGRRMVTLGAFRDEPDTHWLRIIEIPGIVPPRPFMQRGWMALEISVANVVGLAEKLRSSKFTILGEPGPLAVSANIWAMQVAGLAGEVLYLTEVKAPVPPFDLPLGARALAERLFIPVLSVEKRDAAIDYYEDLTATTGLRFETRVSALNRALGVPPEAARSVATLQLQGSSVIEIDEVPEHQRAPAVVDGLPSGIAFVSIRTSRQSLVDNAQRLGITVTPSSSGVMHQTPSGEWLELVPESGAPPG